MPNCSSSRSSSSSSSSAGRRRGWPCKARGLVGAWRAALEYICFQLRPASARALAPPAPAALPINNVHRSRPPMNKLPEASQLAAPWLLAPLVSQMRSHICRPGQRQQTRGRQEAWVLSPSPHLPNQLSPLLTRSLAISHVHMSTVQNHCSSAQNEEAAPSLRSSAQERRAPWCSARPE